MPVYIEATPIPTAEETKERTQARRLRRKFQQHFPLSQPRLQDLLYNPRRSVEDNFAPVRPWYWQETRQFGDTTATLLHLAARWQQGSILTGLCQEKGQGAVPIQLIGNLICLRHSLNQFFPAITPMLHRLKVECTECFALGTRLSRCYDLLFQANIELAMAFPSLNCCPRTDQPIRPVSEHQPDETEDSEEDDDDTQEGEDPTQTDDINIDQTDETEDSEEDEGDTKEGEDPTPTNDINMDQPNGDENPEESDDKDEDKENREPKY